MSYVLWILPFIYIVCDNIQDTKDLYIHKTDKKLEVIVCPVQKKRKLRRL